MVPSLVVVVVELGGIAWREFRHGHARAAVTVAGGADAAGVAGPAATAPDYAVEPGESRLTTAMQRSFREHASAGTLQRAWRSSRGLGDGDGGGGGGEERDGGASPRTAAKHAAALKTEAEERGAARATGLKGRKTP